MGDATGLDVLAGNLITMRSGVLFLIAVVLASVLCSCEGYRISSGTVVDAATGSSLDSVLCRSVDGGTSVMTDTTGKFSVQGRFGGCLGKCPDITVEFSKTGFKSQRLLNPGTNITVRLNR